MSYGKRNDIENPDSRALQSNLTNDALKKLKGWSPDKRSNANANEAPYQVIDFFCGCGGMSLGFAATNLAYNSFQVVGGCDIEPDAAVTFKNNFGAECVLQDIRTLSKSRDNTNEFLSKLEMYKASRPTVLIGCAPCQGFTSHRKKNWHKEDARNSLPAHFAKIASYIDPVCIVMENVPEMLSVKYWEEFQAAKRILNASGYLLKQMIYNAAEFGAPQERFRSVVIGMKREFLLPIPLLRNPEHFSTVRDAIGCLPEVDPGVSHPYDALHRCAAHKKSTIETIKAVPKNGGSRPKGVGPKCLDKIKGFSDVYGRLFWDRPSITITHYSRNPASGRFVHPEQDRGLTMRECALLQTFPEGFSFVGSNDSIYKQIGEAVPPVLATAVAAHVFSELESCEPSSEQLAKGLISIEEPVSSSYSSIIAGIKTSR